MNDDSRIAAGLLPGGVGQRVTPQTFSTWRDRYVEHRLDGLLDALRPGAPRTIANTQVGAMIAKAPQGVPDGATHWSTRSMAREAGLSQSAASRLWRAFGLQPHRQEAFKLSSDPPFVEKVRDIVGLYLDPPLMCHGDHWLAEQDSNRPAGEYASVHHGLSLFGQVILRRSHWAFQR